MPLRRIPSLNWLRVFEAAARTQSFARAAELLAMSPPAVSQQVRALENHLGRALFERHAHAVRLTEAGRSFLPVVAHGLKTLEAGAAGLFGDRVAHRLTLRSQLIFTNGWLVPRLHRFTERHPEVGLTLLTGLQPDDFQRRGADLQITYASAPGPAEDGVWLFGERLSPVACPALAAAIRQPADLARHRLIEIATNASGWHDLLGAAMLPEAPHYLFTDNSETALALAASGHGVALARAPVTDAPVTRHGLVPVEAFSPIRGAHGYHLVYPATERLPRPARAFRDWLLAEAASETG